MDLLKYFEKLYEVTIPRELAADTKQLMTNSWCFLLKRPAGSDVELERWMITNVQDLITKNGGLFLDKLKKNVEELQLIHDKNWKALFEDRKKFAKHVRESFDKYGDEIFTKIEKLTKITWAEKKLTIYLVFDVKNSEVGDSVILPFIKNQSSDENYMISVVHELVHANTRNVWSNYRDAAMKNLLDAYEIATHLIASFVLDSLNNKFGTAFPTRIELLDEKIKNSIELLKRNFDESSGFEDFLLMVHKFLNTVDYTSIFRESPLENYGRLF